jgi:hypothetical protein
MQFTTIIVTSIFAVLATAAPATEPVLEVRDQPLIDLWQDAYVFPASSNATA